MAARKKKKEKKKEKKRQNDMWLRLYTLNALVFVAGERRRCVCDAGKQRVVAKIALALDAKGFFQRYVGRNRDGDSESPRENSFRAGYLV